MVKTTLLVNIQGLYTTCCEDVHSSAPDTILTVVWDVVNAAYTPHRTHTPHCATLPYHAGLRHATCALHAAAHCAPLPRCGWLHAALPRAGRVLPAM